MISLAYLDLDGTLISLLEGDHQSARTINEVNIFSGSKNLVAY